MPEYYVVAECTVYRCPNQIDFNPRRIPALCVKIKVARAWEMRHAYFHLMLLRFQSNQFPSSLLETKNGHRIIDRER